jgi:allophanate hydrolase
MKLDLHIATLRRRYLAGELCPLDVMRDIVARIGDDPHHVWIHRLPLEEIEKYVAALADKDPAALPLYGIPFAIKDNIDLAGAPPTAGCAEYAYQPQRHATVVRLLIEAGAIPIGKTNLDQFATGLNGTRSPYGACRNAYDPEYISGGSSSGSAVAVALGQVSFSLGTDTAGSVRVPAAFNNLAVAYERDGQLDKAREAYDKALALEPNNTHIKQNFDYFKEIHERAKGRETAPSREGGRGGGSGAE